MSWVQLMNLVILLFTLKCNTELNSRAILYITTNRKMVVKPIITHWLPINFPSVLWGWWRCWSAYENSCYETAKVAIFCTLCVLSSAINVFVSSFAVNIGPDETEIAMHINPRFNAHGDENAVVCNSYQGGKWCEEHREGGFPFHQGEEFKVRDSMCDWLL